MGYSSFFTTRFGSTAVTHGQSGGWSADVRRRLGWTAVVGNLCVMTRSRGRRSDSVNPPVIAR